MWPMWLQEKSLIHQNYYTIKYKAQPHFRDINGQGGVKYIIKPMK